MRITTKLTAAVVTAAAIAAPVFFATTASAATAGPGLHAQVTASAAPADDTNPNDTPWE
jgi:hypothetical protein